MPSAIRYLAAILTGLILLVLPLLAVAQTAAPPCGLAGATFCETFDQPRPGVGRTGDLDPDVWGVSRTTFGVNLGQHQYNAAPATDLRGCDGTINVRPPHDVVICNGQLRDAQNDNPSLVFDAGGVTALAMYPKQPFDFAGRTGTVAFDVSNDTHGTHAAWPEFWLSDAPVPVPFNHFDTWQALPKHGFGIRFAASAAPGQWGQCPTGDNLNVRRWTVDSAVVVRGYVMDDTNGFGVRTAMQVARLDCVIQSPDDSGLMNHVELKIAQNQIDVYATDAGTTSPLKHIAVVTNANLSLSRGLIWLEDVHYNADKAEAGPGAPSQRQHTFAWDNVAFDGPFVYRDFSFDALDANQPGPPDNTWNLGKASTANQATSWDVLGLPANPKPEAVRVLFNFFHYDPPATLNVTVNGHAHAVPWPYPGIQGYTWRTLSVTIPVTDLVPGTNVVQIGGTQPLIVSNVNLVLVNVPGGVPVLPGSGNSYPDSTAPPVPTSTPSPTATPSPSPTPGGTQMVCSVTYTAAGVLDRIVCD